jgi:hypothetical protein
LALALFATAASAAAPAGAARVELIRPEDDAQERSLDEEVRAVEARVVELRERISRTKARLAALQELVTGEDAAAGARAVVRHRNEMGASFVLESITCALDGAPVFAETNATGELERKAELEVFSGRLAPGPHVFDVRLVYRVAAGADAERLKVDASHAFDVAAGKLTTVESSGHERRAAALAERAGVRWRVDAAPDRAGTPGGGGGGR